MLRQTGEFQKLEVLVRKWHKVVAAKSKKGGWYTKHWLQEKGGWTKTLR